VADRPTGAARRMVIAEATRSIWRPYVGVGPARQASPASKPPAVRLSRHRAGRLLSLASSCSIAHALAIVVATLRQARLSSPPPHSSISRAQSFASLCSILPS